MMSLPPTVMAVWVWPLAHVTICALLKSPEASTLACGHDDAPPPPPPQSRLHSDVAQRSPKGFWIWLYVCALSNTSMLPPHHHLTPLLHLAACCTVSPRCRLTCGFVVLPPGGEAARQASCGWCTAPAEETGDERIWKCIQRVARCPFGLACAAVARPFHVWDGVRDERGQRRLAGWKSAWDQTAGGGGGFWWVADCMKRFK